MFVYGDLGKAAKKLLTDNYTSDQKLTFKTTTAQKVTYTATGVQDADTNLISGDVAMKMGVAGHAVTTKLFTSGKLTSEVTLDRLGVEGLSVKVLGALSDSGAASAGASAEWNTPSVSATLASDLSSAPTLRATAVAGHGGVYVGGETAYDTAKSETTVADLSISYADRFESEINLQLLNKGTRALLSYGARGGPGLCCRCPVRVRPEVARERADGRHQHPARGWWLVQSQGRLARSAVGRPEAHPAPEHDACAEHQRGPQVGGQAVVQGWHFALY
eukprot:TRINITY_DN871_c0_g1_i4.p1 TRINITY_DN871_c0_g1~~TRINITY_DN871_c0_g1_i4.p1  ORF type:complete len:320 (-),score=47.03 TRINITY_DN871_c0_g1_i4:161-988(-)